MRRVLLAVALTLAASPVLAELTDLPIPDDQFEWPTKRSQQVGLLNAIGMFTAKKCSFMEPNLPNIATGILSYGITLKESMENGYLGHTMAYYDIWGMGRQKWVCEILMRRFGPNGTVVRNLVMPSR